MTTRTVKRMAKTILSGAITGAVAAIAPAVSAQEAPNPAKPNIVMILADDLGYGDLGCYNEKSKVPTPNLDRLASQGVRFTNAYCPDAVCTPSRYALLTGRYAFRARQKPGVLANWEPPMIERDRLTLPGLLKSAGYITAGIGKWHLGATYRTLDGQPPVGQGQFEFKDNGSNLDIAAGIQDGPIDRGFDTWYGFICASETLIVDQSKIVAATDHYERPAAPGAADLQTVVLKDYLPMTADKSIEFIRQQAPAAKEGKPFFLAYFPYVPHIPLAVADDWRGKTRAGEYGDYVHELDHYLGRVFDELDRAGIADNTLVMFASDNGSQFEEGTGDNHFPNAPLRGRKHYIYEGGLRTPFIARWPAKIPAGRTSDQLFCLADVIATVAAAAGTTVPSGQAEDSINMLPAMVGNVDKPLRETVISRASTGQFAIREGDWKYIPETKHHPEQLYNLKADPAETTNRLADNPDVAKRLAERLKQIKSSGSGTRGQGAAK